MANFIFTYSYSDEPEVFTILVEGETFGEAFNVFYSRTTVVGFDSVPMIHDMKTKSSDHLSS